MGSGVGLDDLPGPFPLRHSKDSNSHLHTYAREAPNEIYTVPSVAECFGVKYLSILKKRGGRSGYRSFLKKNASHYEKKKDWNKDTYPKF